MSSSKNILIVNCGSSSIKFEIVNMLKEEILLKGMVSNIGVDNGSIEVEYLDSQKKVEESHDIPTHTEALALMMSKIPKNIQVNAIGHRIVQGGVHFNQPALLNDEAINKIEECIPLAPLHNPHELAGIRECVKAFPGLPQVGTFDTAIHQNKPQVNYMYALPYHLYEKHKIRKYGYHGASIRYVTMRACEILEGDPKDFKFIVCHLGGGSTVTAVDKGVAADTTATFGTACGVPMGTRPGDFDPTLVLYLIDQLNYSTVDVHNMLYKESGMLGLSGITSDMKDLETHARNGNKKAQLARDVYAYALKKYIGSFIASMNGVDAIIFTGGIGENDSGLRKDICSSISWLGIDLDEDKNQQRKKDFIFSKESSKVKLMVILTNEELMMAREVVEVLDKINK